MSEAAHAFAQDMIEVRRVLATEGASVEDARRLSAILRRILVERDIAFIAPPRIERKVKILAPDLRSVYAHEKITPSKFLLVGGAQVFGWDGFVLKIVVFSGVSNPASIPQEKILPKVNRDARIRFEFRGFFRAACDGLSWHHHHPERDNQICCQ